MSKPKLKEGTIFIDYSVTKDCVNSDSYGEICVRCNRCRRFNKKTGTIKVDSRREKS